MIEIKEIRQGNYLHRRGNNELVQIKDTETYIKVSRCPQIYNPIPIDEEWLLKLGFNTFGDELCLKLGHRFFLVFDTCGFGIFTENTDTDEKAAVLHEHIKYIHQIQNLYHALTGEELTPHLVSTIA